MTVEDIMPEFDLEEVRIAFSEPVPLLEVAGIKEENQSGLPK